MNAEAIQAIPGGDAQTRAIRKLLKGSGISPTAQRVEIARFLFQRAQHLCAEQVLTGVNARPSGAHVSKATVYNTLGLFVRHGLLREVLIDPARVFYDSNTRHHHHLYNADTGELSDITTDEVAVRGLPRLPESVELEGIDLVIRVRNRRRGS